MKTLFFDIETTGFNRQKDKIIVFSSCELYKDDASSILCYKMSEDEAILAIAREISGFSHVVSWGGATFDVPFMNHKAKSAGVRLKMPIHTDLMSHYKKIFPKSPHSLSEVSKTMLTKSKKTDFDESTWASASLGDEDAYEKVTKHCVNDVLILKEIWRKVMV